MPTQGQELGGFRLVEPIAEGGMADVWRARHSNGLHAAVKVLRVFGTAEEADRFRNEVRAVARLTHPGIVTILDHGVADDGQPWLAMELVGGGVVAPSRVESWGSLAHLSHALLDSLGHAHARGVIHRDMKPANVLVMGPGDVRHGVKLTDFGIAWTRADVSQDVGQSGTLSYMAPEQIEVAHRQFGPWTDLYGLGCLLWEMLSGAPPFKDHPNQVMAHLVIEPPALDPRFDVPEGMEAWLRRLLAKEPLERFHDAAAARAALVEVDAATAPAPRLTAPPMPAALQGAGMRLFGLRDVPLVGRERERAALRRLLDTVAHDGLPRVAAVRGPAGAGRSRLLRWLAEDLRESGNALPLVLSMETSGGGVTGALLAHFGALGLEGDDLRAHLTWRLGDDSEHQELVGVLAPASGREVTPSERLRVIRRWLVEQSQERPVVCIVDDAHAVRDACLLARRLLEPDGGGTCRALVVISVKEEALAELDPSPSLEVLLLRAEPVPLSPLGRVDRLVLLHRQLAVDPRLASKLDEETGGNPLLAIELLRDYVERGWLEPGPDGLRLVAGRVVIVPSDRLGPWTSRLERAVPSDAVWSDLEVAAALGEDVDAEEWAAVCDPRSIHRRHELLDILLSARLADPTPKGFRFAHPLVRQAVLRNARMSGTFKEIHRHCLAWLQRTGADPERVAGHLVALEEWEKAAEPLLDAADSRHSREGPGSSWEALRLAEQAMVRAGIAPPDRRWVRLWLLRAKVLQERGRHDDALRLLDRADQAISKQVGADQAPWSRHVRGLTLSELGRVDEAMEVHLANARALKPRRGAPDPQLALTLDALSMLAMNSGRFDDAARWAAQAEAVLTKAGLDGRRGINLIRQANIASTVGDEERAAELFDRAEPLVLRYGALTHRAFLYNDRGDLFMKQGRWADAEPLFHRAMELWRAAGYRALTATLNLALCRLRQGRVDEAEALVLDTDIQREREGSVAATAGALVLAVCAARRGLWAALDESLDRAEPGLALIAEADFRWLLRGAAAAATEADQTDRAERCRALAEAQDARITG